MKNKNFVHREMSWTEYGKINSGVEEITVTRSRTTLGHASIILKVGRDSILFNSNDWVAYEDVVRSVIQCLEAALADPCLIELATGGGE